MSVRSVVIVIAGGLSLIAAGCALLLVGQWLGALAFENGRLFALSDYANAPLQTWGRFYGALSIFPLMAGCALIVGGLASICIPLGCVIYRHISTLLASQVQQ